MIGEQNDRFRDRVIEVEQKRNQDYQQLRKINNVITLFEQEKEDVLKLQQKVTFLQSTVVMLIDYKKDRRAQKAQNQLVKDSVQKMIDEALTPQIRKFLPIMIKKIDQLKAFEKKLTSIGSQMQANRQTVETSINSLKSNFQQQIQEGKNALSQQINQLMNLMNSQIKKVSSNTEQLEESLLHKIKYAQEGIYTNTSAINSIQSQLQEKTKQILLQMKNSDDLLQKQMKQYMEIWGQGLFERKKDTICKLVKEGRPQQQKDQYDKIVSTFNNIQPILSSVKTQIQKTMQALINSQTKLNQNLLNFSNQITKMKSNIAVDKNNTVRLLDSFQDKLASSYQFIQQLSYYSAKLTESILLQVCLQLQPSDQKQVFVTYNDGLVFESQGGVGTYRRKNLHPEIARRALIQTVLKEVDNVVANLGQFGWNKTANKPSAFFKKIYESYLQISEQDRGKNHLEAKDRPQGTPPHIKRKALQTGGLWSQSREKGNRDILSRTIDMKSLQFRSYQSSTKPNTDRQKYTHRRSIKLGKINQQDL